MPVINMNQILTYMENNESTLEEAFAAYNLQNVTISDDVRNEFQRQMELHNKNVAENGAKTGEELAAGPFIDLKEAAPDENPR